MRKKTKLPSIPHAFFKWYCRTDLYEELHGDLEEFYYERLAEKGRFKATMFYLWNVIRCFQPYSWDLSTSRKLHGIMFRNYLKTSYRGMIKNPLNTFINIFGLAVAVGACMVTYAFMDFDYSMDRFHENKDEVYLTTFLMNKDGIEQNYGTSPTPLGAMLQEDFSSIKHMTRVLDINAVVKQKNNVFHESIRYVDPSFLQMFSFPLKWGSASSLADPKNIVLSSHSAVKFFGDSNPIGKEIQVIFNNEVRRIYNVSGVAEDFPEAHIIEFGFLLNFENLKATSPSFDFNDWNSSVNATFIQVEDPSQLAAIKEAMSKYSQLKNEVKQDWQVVSFDFVKLHDLHFASRYIRDDISYDGSKEGRVSLPIVALFILFLACFNYINIAIVTATRRLKEIGLRKVVGADKQQLIVQFLFENLFVTFFAGLIGFGLAVTIFLPWFGSFSDIASNFNFLDLNLWIFLISVLLFTGIVSGLYPAIYISKFEIVKIFKGTLKFGSNNSLTKFLLSAQLVLACIGITFAVMFAQNSAYQSTRSWGYNQKEVLFVNVANNSSFQKLKTALEQNPDVISITGSGNHLGRSMKTTSISHQDRLFEVAELSVGPNYFATLGIEIAEGRGFEKDKESDFRAIIINPQFAETIKLDDPIGSQVKIDSVQFTIVGVSENFHYNNFYYKNKPTIFTLSQKQDIRYLSALVRPGSEKVALKSIQKEWTKLEPITPFLGGYQEDVWVGFYDELGVMQSFSLAIAIVFVLIAGLGLYGMVKLNISGRMKEFSIRKTLGADIKNLATNIFSKYILLSIAAIIIGAPVGHIMISALIDMMFPDPKPFGYTGAIISSFLLMIVLITVISTQIRKVSQSNTVDGLKTE